MSLVYPIKGRGKSTFTNIEKDQFQQNCVETTCDRLFSIEGQVVVGEGFKSLPKFTEMLPEEDEKGKYWNLKADTAYSFESNVQTEIADGECFDLIHRSTFNRCGIRVVSALYDSGFKGGANGTIYVGQCPLKLYKGTRIAQIKLQEAETQGTYKGQYQNTQGASDTISNKEIK